MKDGGLPNKLNHMTSYCDKGAGILVVNFSTMLNLVKNTSKAVLMETTTNKQC